MVLAKKQNDAKSRPGGPLGNGGGCGAHRIPSPGLGGSRSFCHSLCQPIGGARGPVGLLGLFCRLGSTDRPADAASAPVCWPPPQALELSSFKRTVDE